MLARMVIGWLGFGTLKVCSRIRNRIRNKSLRIQNSLLTSTPYLGVSQSTSAGGLPVTAQSNRISVPTRTSVSLDIS